MLTVASDSSVVIPSREKRCVKCKETKDISAFGKDIRRSDGLFPYCKRCRLRDPDAFDIREHNKSLGLKKCSDCKLWLALDTFYPNPSNPDGFHTQCRLCSIKRVKDYYQRNLEKVRERDRLYSAQNTDKRAKRWASYYSRNSHALLVRANQRRRKYDPSLDTLTGKEWKQIIRDQGGKCLGCGRAFNSKFIPTRDHIIALSKGGYLTRENTAALCRSCNARKGNR
jgi:5-methylcytosine-specific restriction endonuclease McrA